MITSYGFDPKCQMKLYYMHIEICIEENSYMVFLYEGMAGRVQEFVTIRIGSLWVDVPMGPAQVSNSASSLNTTAASPVVAAEDQEVNSKPTEGFTPVVTKAAKRRQEELLLMQGWQPSMNVLPAGARLCLPTR
jgi:hypothetical protein